MGRDGALRLEALDRENAAWEARMQAHLAQRAQIQGDVALAESAKVQALEALRKKNFSAEEQARVVALEGVEDEVVAGGVGGVVRR